MLPGTDDDWVLARRAELADQYHDVLRLLTTALIDAGRPMEATNTARELVRAQPLDEIAHRLRIEAHQRAGDRAGAIRAYHECATTLARELDVSPDAATLALYHELGTEGGGRIVKDGAQWLSPGRAGCRAGAAAVGVASGAPRRARCGDRVR